MQEQFDVVSLNGCLEAAVYSQSHYQKCLAKQKTLLKPGEIFGNLAHARPNYPNYFVLANRQCNSLTLIDHVALLPGSFPALDLSHYTVQKAVEEPGNIT